jgi:hypothetical protein
MALTKHKSLSPERKLGRMLKKMQSGHPWNGLTFAQCETVEKSLFDEHLTYATAAERVTKEFGRGTSLWSIGRFYRCRARVRTGRSLALEQRGGEGVGMAIQPDQGQGSCFSVHHLVSIGCAGGRKRVGRLHALRYSGRSPRRCFSPVLIRLGGESAPMAINEHLPQSTCWLAANRSLRWPGFRPSCKCCLSVPGRRQQTSYPRLIKPIKTIYASDRAMNLWKY